MWLHSHITNASGSSKYIYSSIKELSKKYEITLFLQKPITYYKSEFEKLPIKIVILSDCSTSDLKFWITFSSQLKKQKRKLKTQYQNFDLIISSFFPMNIVANFIPLPHLQFCFQPYVFFWDKDLVNSQPFHKKLLLKILKSKFGDLDISATRKANSILTINNGSKDFIFQIYQKQAIPTFMGIDPQIIIEKTDEMVNKFRERKVLIHTTDWSPAKKTTWLIQQFEEIQRKYENVVLLITETKIEKKSKQIALNFIKERSIRNIQFLGTVPRKNLPKYLSIADIVLYTGAGAGITTSLFLLECMALQTPAVVNYEVSEDVENGKTGYIFKTESEFQENVLKILNDKQLKEKMGMLAKEYVLKKHTWENVAKIFEREICELL